MTVCQVIKHPIASYLEVVLTTCAYAGTANVLEIQKLVQTLSEHIKDEDVPEEEKKDEAKKDEPKKEEAKDGEESGKETSMKGRVQEVAVLGVALIAQGEEVASQMALRALDHALQYALALSIPYLIYIVSFIFASFLSMLSLSLSSSGRTCRRQGPLQKRLICVF